MLLLPFFAISMALADPVDDYLKLQMERNHIPGLVVAVVKNGHVLKLKAYGKANLEWDAPVTTDTRFQLASTTKALTGTALMTLVQAGKIGLDDPLSKYLQDAPPAWRGITIRQLATHSSGIPDLPGLDLSPETTVAIAVKKVAELPLSHAPGDQAGYGSADFVVLSRIMEVVTGKSFPQLLQSQLFDPLAMKDSAFDEAIQFGPVRRSIPIPKRASVYYWDTKRQQIHAFIFPSHAYSAGGLYSSVSDLAKWISALDNGKILSSQARATMWTQGKLSNGVSTDWGIGWVSRTYEGRRVVGHSGGPALSDVLHFVDDGLTVIVLQNQQKMYPYLAQGVADIYLPLAKVRPYHPIKDPDPSQTLRFRQLLDSLRRGKLDTKPFAAGHEDLIQDVSNLLGPYSRSLGAMSKFELVEAEGRSFVFAGVYGRKVVNWLFDLDADGRIVAMNCATP